MKSRQPDEWIRSQRTVRYVQEGKTGDPRLEDCYRYFERMHSHMLLEDIRTQIIPYEGFSKRKSFSVELVPNAAGLEEFVASAFKDRDHYSRQGLQAAVTEFIRECAQSVVAFGEATYELVYLSPHEEPMKVEGFELRQVQLLTVKRSANGFVQTVPSNIAERLGVPHSISLVSDTIFVFDLPKSIARSLKTTLDSLAVLSEKLVPEFALKDLPTAASKYRYDSADQVYSQKLALAEAGKKIGWNARTLFSGEILEFYELKRQLRFEKLKVQLRDSILKTLNRALAVAGQKMGFETQIRLNGLPVAADIDAAEADLDAGRRRFGDILGQFLYY